MEYFIDHRPSFSTLRILLNQNEQIRAEAGAMIAMSPDIQLQAKTTGKGFFGAIKATMGGESMFSSIFTSNANNAELILAPTTIGDIIPIELNNETVFANGGSFLAGNPEIEISTQGSLKALMSGTGLFLQKLTGTGLVFINSYGAIIERTLGQNEKYIIDTSHIVAFSGSTEYAVKRAAKGMFSTIASREALICEFSGPGKIWFQTRNLPAFAQLLYSLMPKSNN
ncbi:MAG TPA: TIGR00266 family protein [Bacteroidota bacterium]|nr:TIGR00266 family protein [Candidatus Kapabacteria bacterium]HRS01702.1 TIGR00266 family protein [Bacteroidota bacterium]